MENLENKYHVIIDTTDNSFKPYIDLNNNNTGCLDNVLRFETEENAKDYIAECGWEEWAGVEFIEE